MRRAEGEEIPSEWHKTLLAVLLVGLATVGNFVVLSVIHDTAPRGRLPDLLFFLFPQRKWAWIVSDYVSSLSSVVGVVTCLLHKRRAVVLRRVCLVGAVLYVMRAACLAFTNLPPSFDHSDDACLPQVCCPVVLKSIEVSVKKIHTKEFTSWNNSGESE